MKNILLNISYDGSQFFGFQRQPNKRTIQGELEKAIKKVTGEDVNIIPCGRTDAGVHAKSHISNFITNSDLPGISFKYKLQKFLPKDIEILGTKEVDLDFHSRFNAKFKTYQYVIVNNEYMLPYHRNYKTLIKKDLDIEKMIKASKKLIGRHNFRGFMKWGDDEKNPIRKIDSIEIYCLNDEIIFEFTAESFLHSQIRIMVGLLIDIGRGYRDIDYIDEVFNNPNIRAAKTLPANGLYLMKIVYKNLTR